MTFHRCCGCGEHKPRSEFGTQLIKRQRGRPDRYNVRNARCKRCDSRSVRDRKQVETIAKIETTRIEMSNEIGRMTSKPLVAIVDGKAVADSRVVAEVFGKPHYDVLKAIRALHCSDEFRQGNFSFIKMRDLTGESTSHALMTKNGAAFLVLGFTGEKAAQFKEAYIAAFDEMEKRLLAGAGSNVVPMVPGVSAAAGSAIQQAIAQAVQSVIPILKDETKAEVAAEFEERFSETGRIIQGLNDMISARDEQHGNMMVIVADELEKFARMAHVVAKACKTGEFEGRKYLGKDWQGVPEYKGDFSIHDVMLGLGFKTRIDADNFSGTIGLSTTSKFLGARDSNRQMEMDGLVEVVSPRMKEEKYLHGAEFTNSMVTPSGRAYLESRLVSIRAKFDLRPAGEQFRIRSMLMSRRDAGALTELRNAYDKGCNPDAKGFSHIRPKMIEAAK